MRGANLLRDAIYLSVTIVMQHQRKNVDYVVVYRGYKNDKSDELGLKLAKAITVTIGAKTDT